MEEALQKRIKIKGKKEVYSEEVDTRVMAAHIFFFFFDVSTVCGLTRYTRAF